MPIIRRFTKYYKSLLGVRVIWVRSCRRQDITENFASFGERNAVFRLVFSAFVGVSFEIHERSITSDLTADSIATAVEPLAM